ncbi:MAG: FAD-binding oxidoreductase [Solirubrobacterales bacterium]
MSAAELRRDTVWWGWGRTEDRPSLGDGPRAMLADRLGELEPADRARMSEVELPEAQPVPSAVVSATGGEGAVSTSREDRIRHAAGKSYPDLVRLRRGTLVEAPDAVIAPPDASSVAAVLEACAREHVAVVPFGGGTSVVGGVHPARREFDRLISLDLERMRRVEVDPVSMTATLGAGLRGPEAEAALAGHGVTLGHFPQSFVYATIGGFAATRSAGQASTGYGRFDEITTALRMQTTRGELATLQTPHTAAGPSVRELIVGSEGTLGVITEVSARVRPAPASKRYEAWFAPGWEAGIEIGRRLAQEGVSPDVFRLSDRNETEVSLELAGLQGARKNLFEGYLKLRGRGDGCMMICGWEGEREAVSRRRELSAAILRREGAVPLGRGAGDSWAEGRFEGPYLRDALMDAGVMVETLETSHTYSELGELYRGVGEALKAAMAERGAPGLVMCHVSHIYRDGASLYFTFLSARNPGAEIEQWHTIKSAACSAIVDAEGTITHHHAVGRDHVPYMRAEIGELGVEALRGVKERLDPAGIMNPGKLLPA